MNASTITLHLCKAPLRAAAAAATALVGLVLAAEPAHAQPEPRGWQASIYVLSSRLGSTSLDETGTAGFGPGLQASFGQGAGFGGDIGYRYGNGWAAELEWNYRRHPLKSLKSGASTLASDGDYASNILFVNGLRRFADAKSPWTPYLGAGLGWVQEIDFDIQSAGVERSYSKGGRAALQLIAGAEYALGDAWRLTADLRWLRVGGVELVDEGRATERLARPAYNPVSVQLGVRRRF